MSLLERAQKVQGDLDERLTKAEAKQAKLTSQLNGQAEQFLADQRSIHRATFYDELKKVSDRIERSSAGADETLFNPAVAIVRGLAKAEIDRDSTAAIKDYWLMRRQG